MSSKQAEKIRSRAEELRERFGGPMDEKEIALLRDMQAFIEFCIQNGLSFTSVIATLAHDVTNIVHLGFSLENVREDGFLPKVTGYSKLTPDAIGAPEEAAQS